MPADKIMNMATGRMVLRTGKIGKMLLAQQIQPDTADRALRAAIRHIGSSPELIRDVNFKTIANIQRTSKTLNVTVRDSQLMERRSEYIQGCIKDAEKKVLEHNANWREFSTASKRLVTELDDLHALEVVGVCIFWDLPAALQIGLMDKFAELGLEEDFLYRGESNSFYTKNKGVCDEFSEMFYESMRSCADAELLRIFEVELLGERQGSESDTCHGNFYMLQRTFILMMRAAQSRFTSKPMFEMKLDHVRLFHRLEAKVNRDIFDPVKQLYKIPYAKELPDIKKLLKKLGMKMQI